MTRAEEIRAGLDEPVELLRSKSGSWHLFNERLDERLAKTRCRPVPRIVMVGKLATVTGLAIAYWFHPLPQPGEGGKTCGECEWTEAAFGSAWPLVIAEVVMRALKGIRNDDIPVLALEWGVPDMRPDMETAGSLSPEGTRHHTEGHSVEGRNSGERGEKRNTESCPCGVRIHQPPEAGYPAGNGPQPFQAPSTRSDAI